MRKSVFALSLAFAIGGLGSTAYAGEGCNFSSHAKKNDLEAPPPASTVNSNATVQNKPAKAVADKAT
ncbi:MAG: hypothetical protein HOI95_29360 [Chromatiales bacterium]|jgi:hypothetical protein|nr:hypothetical protein [Chromatiales bacterium]